MSQIVAIPLLEDEVAPRFCFARRLLLVWERDGEVVERFVLEVEALDWMERLRLLSARGVTLLLCGGFNRTYLPYAQGLGVEVSWGHAGSSAQLLDALCAGTLPPPVLDMGGWGRRGGRGRGRGRGAEGGFGPRPGSGPGSGAGRGAGRGPRGRGAGRGPRGRGRQGRGPQGRGPVD